MNRSLYWLCQVLGWSLYAGLNMLALLASGALSPASAGSMVSAGTIGLLVSHALRTLAHRGGWKRLGPAQLAPRVVVASTLGAVAMLALQLPLVLFVFRIFAPSDVSLGGFVFYGLQNTTLLLLWQVLYFGINAAGASRRAELERLQSLAETRAAELRALRSQLNPHFLFNSLNTLRALIAEDPARAQEAVTRLSSLLRYVLAAGEEQTVSLGAELDVVNDYLALEVLRFEERLQVAIDVPAECRAAHVPMLLVQTLVENAVKHGIARSVAGGEVRLVARKSGDALEITITNPTGTSRAPTESSGVGLENTQERLRLLFGDAARFQLTMADALTTASVHLPWSTR